MEATPEHCDAGSYKDSAMVVSGASLVFVLFSLSALFLFLVATAIVSPLRVSVGYYHASQDPDKCLKVVGIFATLKRAGGGGGRARRQSEGEKEQDSIIRGTGGQVKYQQVRSSLTAILNNRRMYGSAVCPLSVASVNAAKIWLG